MGLRDMNRVGEKKGFLRERAQDGALHTCLGAGAGAGPVRSSVACVTTNGVDGSECS